MKRLLCVILILCVIPVVASATDYIDRFNDYAAVFGLRGVEGNGQTVKSKTMYIVDGSYVGFQEDENTGELSSIFVSGEGDNLLIYTISAICVMENTTNHFSDNCGLLLTQYLMCRMKQETVYFSTKGGLFVLVEPYNGEYMTVIER